MIGRSLPLAAGLCVVAFALSGEAPRPDHAADFKDHVLPTLKKYCLDCHSTRAKKGSLDLERFRTVEDVRKSVKPWQQTIEMIEHGEMPPKGKAQPGDGEKKKLVGWIQSFLDAEARARAGDPGFVPLRRLSNAEYDATIRDLTGVDLLPTREFPADGAGGEGFTNAAESLTDISPALLTKYLNAAKAIADHAVLLPDGFRFSAKKSRRDWTDEATAKLQAFYRGYTDPQGRPPLRPHLATTVRHREALSAGKIADVAAKEKLNPKYLGVLWQALTDKTPSHPLDAVRTRWRAASEKDLPALEAEIAAHQAALWRFVQVGSYRYNQLTRQVANDPPAATSQTVRLTAKPAGAEAVLHLAAKSLTAESRGPVVWGRPRFEKAGSPPLLLRDYATFGPAFEVDPASVFADAAKYLAAAADVAHGRKPADGLDAALLKRWVEMLALEALIGKTGERVVPLVELTPLDEKSPRNPEKPAINGWRRKGADLPTLVTNSSDKTELIPGTVPGHRVAVHPTPSEFVAVVWRSPVEGKVRVTATVKHAHPACGNGVAWWVEHRRDRRAVRLGDGLVDLGWSGTFAEKLHEVKKGDSLILAVDARDGNHICDMTQIDFTITEDGKPGRVWDLAKDIADTIHAGNPHADRHGNKETWGFVKGPSRPVGKGNPNAPPGSALARWRDAAAAGKPEAAKFALAVQTLLTGAPPKAGPDQALHARLTAPDGPLLKGLDLSRVGKRLPGTFGLAKEKFTADGGLSAEGDIEIRLPAALLRGRDFVADVRLAGEVGGRVVQAQAHLGAWDGKGAVLAAPGGEGYKRLVAGHEAFRRVFPVFVCFPPVVPTDEVVTLKMFHREDEPLSRLFLDEAQQKRIDHLWAEHRFISRQAVLENEYLPQFIGYVTQDQPKELLAYFEGQRPAFKARADALLKDEAAAIPRQLDALLDFAALALRRPLDEKQKAGLRGLYDALRKKGAGHEEAFKGVLARMLVSPGFLFRVEKAPAGEKAGPVDDWELASRLSYFLTSSGPDAELRRLAAEGKLRDPKALAEQAGRLLKGERVRALAIEFGTQWLHVRGFDDHNEKNEKLFPTFDAKLRAAIYEESILFFQDLFQADRPVSHILDADATFLNEALAKHYGIPGVTGAHWRRVEGVKKYGRGGILGLASVQAKQSGASRTSPVLRGNWVVETLLGEKLPRPPANVPQLPEVEGADKLTTRQLVERHAKDPACAVCHVRIDPYGFALERYDAIGRRRAKDMGGSVIDAKARLKDGSEFEGLEGLRTYLMTKKKDVFVKLFCRKLLGYALGRSTTLSDQALIDEMAAALGKKDAGVSAAVTLIVRSPQFRMIRGADHAAE